MTDTAETDALFRAALDHYDRDEAERAAAMFVEVLSRAPDHVEAAYKLGNLHSNANRFEEASRLYLRILNRQPGYAEVRNNLGTVLQAQGAYEKAEDCYREAIATKPELPQPRLNLGRLLQERGNEAAAAAYRNALGNGHDADVFGHLLAAVEGRENTRAPDAYVRETFDFFAKTFDERLVNEFNYCVPTRLANLVQEHTGSRKLDILDLGCGTGLCGVALQSSLNTLTGVDLSPEMLEESRKRGLYSQLEIGEISAWLAQAPSKGFDLVLAADVFIYSGDLSSLFKNIARCLRNNGLFAFSVESCSGADWRLLASGRYAQANEYLRRLADKLGFRVVHTEPSEVRKGIDGELWLLERHQSHQPEDGR